MPTLEYCQIEMCKTVTKGFFSKTIHHWEAQKEIPGGKETLYKSDEFSLLYSGDPQKMANDRKQEKAAREQVVKFMIGEGWEPAAADDEGNVVSMKREISAQKVVPAPNTIVNRLKTLTDVHEAGLISDEEFTQKRKEILGEI